MKRRGRAFGLLVAAGAAVGALACASAAGSNGAAAAGEATAVRRSLEDVFLSLTQRSLRD